MDRVPPVKESSLVKSLGHQGETLEVELQTGEVYRYEPVQEPDFRAMRSAPSPGKYLNEYIKPACDCWKLVRKVAAKAVA